MGSKLDYPTTGMFNTQKMVTPRWLLVIPLVIPPLSQPSLARNADPQRPYFRFPAMENAKQSSGPGSPAGFHTFGSRMSCCSGSG